MERFTLDELPGIASAWDAAVDRTPEVDVFCASSRWAFAAAASFPDVEPPVVVGDGTAFCGMRATTTEDGTRLLVGLDPVWGFATPSVGHPVLAARMTAARLSLEPHDLAVIAGQREDFASTACLAQALGDDRTLYRGATEHRLRIDLGSGFDAWFARRSSRFRQRMRQIEQRAAEREVQMVDLSAMAPDDVLDRVLAIEERSWKGAEGTGLTSGDLAGFYRRVAAGLASRDHLRVLVARLDDRDIGYVLGGIRADTYRGLQLSYDGDHADLGLGHLLQLHQLRALEREGVAVYDLGMDMEYKRRWADRVDSTMSLVVGR